MPVCLRECECVVFLAAARAAVGEGASVNFLRAAAEEGGEAVAARRHRRDAQRAPMCVARA